MSIPTFLCQVYYANPERNCCRRYHYCIKYNTRKNKKKFDITHIAFNIAWNVLFRYSIDRAYVVQFNLLCNSQLTFTMCVKTYTFNIKSAQKWIRNASNDCLSKFNRLPIVYRFCAAQQIQMWFSFCDEYSKSIDFVLFLNKVLPQFVLFFCCFFVLLYLSEFEWNEVSSRGRFDRLQEKAMNRKEKEKKPTDRMSSSRYLLFATYR